MVANEAGRLLPQARAEDRGRSVLAVAGGLLAV